MNEAHKKVSKAMVEVSSILTELSLNLHTVLHNAEVAQQNGCQQTGCIDECKVMRQWLIKMYNDIESVHVMAIRFGNLNYMEKLGTILNEFKEIKEKLSNGE